MRPLALILFLCVCAPHAAAATLSGTVTDADTGLPVHPVRVSLLDSSTGDFLGLDAQNQPDGTWTLNDVPAGDYRVLFIADASAEVYLDVLYPGDWCDNTGCDRATIGGVFTVSDGANQLDQTLARGYLLSGTVTDHTGTPLQGVFVDVFDDQGNYVCCANASDADGTWDRPVPDLGEYRALVPTWAVTRYVPEIWDGIPCEGCDPVTSGTPIDVAGNVAGIDFSLEVSESIGESATVLDDVFSEGLLNSCRWLPETDPATANIDVDGALTLSSNDGGPYAVAVNGVNGVDGDFSMTIRMTPGTGWNDLPNGFHVPNFSVGPNPVERFGINVLRFSDGNTAVQAFIRTPPEQQQILNTINIGAFDDGMLRLSRNGDSWTAEFDIDGSWQAIATADWSVEMVYPRLELAQVGTTHPVSVDFDEFAVENGTLRAGNRHTRISRFLPRSDMMIGGVFENHVVQRAFGNRWVDPVPTTILADAGMNWARVGMTNYYAPELAGLPTSAWPPWQEDGLYWAANETRIQMLKDARDAGMNLVAYYYLSGRYGEWVGNIGQANAPQGWEDFTLEETLVAVEEFSATLTQRLIDEGLDIEIYEIGNETDWGLAGFDPRDKVQMPYEANWLNDVPIVRDNLWAPQAQIHIAAIRGIRSVDPTAKFALHPTGLIDVPATYFAKAYFKYMIEQGVDFDFAAISWPYPYSNGDGVWDVNRYSVPCWFYSIEELTAWLHALGKPVYVAEGSYGASAAPFQVQPMEGLPFDEAGQAEWMSTILDFVSNNLNMLGFFYFYPEFFDGMTGQPNNELEAYGFFDSDSEAAARQVLSSLNANLAEPASVQSSMSGIWEEPGQSGEVWALNVYREETPSAPGLLGVNWCSGQSETGQNQRVHAVGYIRGNRVSIAEFLPRGETVFRDGFDLEVSARGETLGLSAEIAFRNASEANFSWNGDAAWDSGRFEIQRTGPLNGTLNCQ